MESRTARNLSIKIDVDGASACIITRDRKISGGGEMEEGGVLVFGFVYPTVDRQYRRCKYLTKIRRLSFSALFVSRVSTAVRSRKPVRCLRNYLPPRSFDSIGNFRRMKSVFLFPSFFLSSSSVLLLFCFLFPIGRLGIGSRRLSRKSIATTRLSISRAEKYRRGILIVDAFVAPLFPRVEWRNLDMNK